MAPCHKEPYNSAYPADPGDRQRKRQLLWKNK